MKKHKLILTLITVVGFAAASLSQSTIITTTLPPYPLDGSKYLNGLGQWGTPAGGGGGGGGSAPTGTVVNTNASAGLLAVDATKTNGVAATTAMVQSTLGQVYQATNANLTGWSAIPATSAGVQATLGQVYQATNSNLTGWSAITADSAGVQSTLGQVYQSTNSTLTTLAGTTTTGTGQIVLSSVTDNKQPLAATLTALSTNTTTGTGRIVLESAAGGGSAPVGTVINSTVSNGLLAVDSTKTNGTAATAAMITNAWGIFDGSTTKFVAGDGTLRTSGGGGSTNLTDSGTNVLAQGGILANNIVSTNGLASPSTNSILVSTSAKGFKLGNGQWWTGPVPYLRPSSAGGVAFDIMPNTGTANCWIDIVDTDIEANQTNYEDLHLQKYASGRGSICTSAAGTGTYRDLVLQERGGNLGIGPDATTPSYFVHIAKNQNAQTPFTVENATSGTTAWSSIAAKAGTNLQGQVLLEAFSPAWTSNGAYKPASASLDASTGLTNGLSIVARNSSAPIRFYAGGFADTNLALTVTSNLVVSAQNLAVRNSTTPMSVTVNNTYTDDSNYERGMMSWSGNTLKIGTEQAGTGVARPVSLESGSSVTVNSTLAVVKAIQQYQGTLTHAGTVTLDFDGTTTVNQIALTGNVTFATSNLQTNRTYRLLVKPAATNCTPTWPGDWRFIGGRPTTLTANRWGMLSLESWGSTDTNVVAVYSEEQ